MDKKIKAIIFIISIFFTGFLFFSPANAQTTITSFDLNPKIVPTVSSRTNFQMTLRVTIDIARFNSECGSNANEFSWYIYRDVTGLDIEKVSGTQTISRTSTSLNLNLDKTVVIDTSADSQIQGEGGARYYASIYCPDARPRPFSSSLDDSDKVEITFGLTDTIYACIAADGRYACSQNNLENCSDVSACAGRQCGRINVNLCGDPALRGPIPGPGGPIPGSDQTVTVEIPPPGGAETLTDLAKAIARFLLQIAIPIAVIVIIYAGTLYLTSRGDKDQVKKATTALKYAVIGLAIILIGQGFVTLIESILNLGGPTP